MGVSRREFLGAAGAGLLGGALGRWTKDGNVGVKGQWKSLSYTSDLQWVVGDWDDSCSIGNGTATLRYRRNEGLLVCSLKLVVGSTTTFGAGAGAWFFELPDELVAGQAATTEVFTNADALPGPMFGIGSCEARRPGVAPYVGVCVIEPNRQLGGGVGGTESHATLRAVLEYDKSNVTNTSPFTWTTGDILVMQAVVEAFDN